MNTKPRPDWEVYERLIARLVANQLEANLCVTPNARLIGKISARSRQLDVLVEPRHDREDKRRIVVEAKAGRRKVDVKDVESFLGVMQDVEATHGYLVCPTGYTESAQRRAQSAISLRLVPLDRIKDFDPSEWPECLASDCSSGRDGRVFWDGYPELSLVLRRTTKANSSPISLAYIHYVGKCDRCGRFHVQCLTCREIMLISEDDAEDVGRQCSCKLPWFWIASVERGEKGNRSAELHVVLGVGHYETVNRRAL